MTIRLRWLEQSAYIFLSLPFILFCLGWLRPWLGVSLAIVIAAILVYIFRSMPNQDFHCSLREFCLAAIMVSIWLLFSGIGGYAFQNWDFHGRNAIFHDLINYSWPVIYPNGAGIDQPLIMSYYMGFWLPSALVGKLLGWDAANFALFIWTWLGVGIFISLVSKKIQLSLPATTLLIIFFSGMDILGVLLRLYVAPETYTPLWPGTTQLEWWSGGLQYSSITTLIYWVQNQSLPILIGMALLINQIPIKHLPFLACLCLFLGPIPSLGLLVYFISVFILESFKSKKDSGIFTKISVVARNLLTPETILGSGAIFLICLVYFSTNQAIQKRSFQFLNPFTIILFFLIEGGLVWLLMVVFVRKDFLWIITGLLLLFIPFIKLGNNQDFTMRASIAPLFFLMIGIGKYLHNYRRSNLAKIIFFCLIIGAVTPIYEINRSFVRSVNYYFSAGLPVARPELYTEEYRQKHANLFIPEIDHPDTLVADDIKTLAEPFGWRDNFVGNLKGTIFYQYFIYSH